MLGQARKRLERSMKVSWREKPTSRDVAAIRDHRDRMGLVIKTRWQITAVLIAFAVGYYIAFASRHDTEQIERFSIPFFLLLIAMLLINGLYQATYRRLANVAFLNWSQLLVDVIYIGALVHLTGGPASLMWPLMLLVVIEGAVIIGPAGAWGLGAFAVLVLGVVNLIGAVSGVEGATIPFGLELAEEGPADRLVIYAWQAAVVLGMALTSNSLLRILSRPQQAPAARTLIDEMTGLISAPHFTKLLDMEVARATRSGEGVHLLLIDLDEFGVFNTRFGIDAGDTMIGAVARVLSDVVMSPHEGEPTSNVAARLSGEEFGVLFAERLHGDGPPDSGDAARLAETIRARIAALRVDDAGVTVSIGIASSPDDALTTPVLIDVADAALSRAVGYGGNRIEAAGSGPEEDDVEYLPIGPFDQ